ncbi:MAG: hypothetical protein HYS78_00040 [Parcubacteria group bacterium]|nr:hypothetical protein [Parcubacteria group bacterium]
MQRASCQQGWPDDSVRIELRPVFVVEESMPDPDSDTGFGCPRVTTVPLEKVVAVEAAEGDPSRSPVLWVQREGELQLLP